LRDGTLPFAERSQGFRWADALIRRKRFSGEFMRCLTLYQALVNSPFLFCLSFSLLVSSAWVRAGAPSIEEGRRHWAFLPLHDEALPTVSRGEWCANEVDRYVLAKLEAAGLKPSAEADRTTLIRRVTLDLIGLPPTLAEVDAFMADESPQAYEKVIDRLLDSPHYGERWGRHWLDLARYADTCGFHNDQERTYAWKYRDYVIRSFNEDKPYPRFIAEQIAGDEVDGANEESLIATGFCRNGPSNDDNMGKTPEALAQYRADQMDDVIATTSSVFLGLTVGCARCHDHKTDPILARDYYSMFAIFNGTEKLGMAQGAKNKDDKVIHDQTKVMALVETKSAVPPTFILQRGLAANPGDEVGPAVPVVLSATAPRFRRQRSDLTAASHVRGMDGLCGKSPGMAGDGEPAMAASFWRRHRGQSQQFWVHWDSAFASRTAGLLSRAVDGKWWASEAATQADADECDLSADQYGDVVDAGRSRQSTALAHE
jgi:hypothetical protein